MVAILLLALVLAAAVEVISGVLNEYPLTFIWTHDVIASSQQA